jgi:hypothetical protein
MNTFESHTFYYCYDCGYGERGVHENNLSFHKAFEIIKDRAGLDTAENWRNSKDGYFEFCGDYHMVSDKDFLAEHWESSDDW